MSFPTLLRMLSSSITARLAYGTITSLFAPYAAVHMPHGVFDVASGSASTFSCTSAVMTLALLEGVVAGREYLTVGGVKILLAYSPRVACVCQVSPRGTGSHSIGAFPVLLRLCSGVSVLGSLVRPQTCDTRATLIEPSGRRIYWPSFCLSLFVAFVKEFSLPLHFPRSSHSPLHSLYLMLPSTHVVLTPALLLVFVLPR